MCTYNGLFYFLLGVFIHACLNESMDIKPVQSVKNAKWEKMLQYIYAAS